jgi:hypothetical protein
MVRQIKKTGRWGDTERGRRRYRDKQAMIMTRRNGDAKTEG